MTSASEHVEFPSCDEEGGAPEFLPVFFARTVKSGDQRSQRSWWTL